MLLEVKLKGLHVKGPISNIKHLAVKTCFDEIMTEETGYKMSKLVLFEGPCNLIESGEL